MTNETNCVKSIRLCTSEEEGRFIGVWLKENTMHEAHAARSIEEVFEVIRETGKTPRELAAENEALRKERDQAVQSYAATGLDLTQPHEEIPMTEPKTDQQFTDEDKRGVSKMTNDHMGVTEEMHIAYHDAWDVAIMERNEFSDVALSQSIAAAINASGLPQEIARLQAENEALRRERDQAVQSYAADRERFAAQEERHRVKITEQAERNRELEKLVERGINGCECVCAEEAYFCEGFVKCWRCEAEDILAKHRRTGE